MTSVPLSPAGLWCAPDIHLARVEADIVILDAARDEYHCLPGAAAQLQVSPEDRIDSPDPAMLAELAAVGLAVETQPMRARRPIRPARRELPPGAPASRTEHLRAAWVLLAATARFRGRSFAGLVGRPETVTETAPVDEERLARLVGAARRVRPWIPLEGECLQRAFQLRAYLAGRGVAVDWVFGVRTWPFSAHCWLQHDDLVVGDRLERVCRYTPILSV